MNATVSTYSFDIEISDTNYTAIIQDRSASDAVIAETVAEGVDIVVAADVTVKNYTRVTTVRRRLTHLNDTDIVTVSLAITYTSTNSSAAFLLDVSNQIVDGLDVFIEDGNATETLQSLGDEAGLEDIFGGAEFDSFTEPVITSAVITTTSRPSPSPTPLPTPSPTISPTTYVAPVENVTLVPSRLFVDVNVSLGFALADNSGAVYCLVLKSGETPSNTAQMRTQGTSASYSSIDDSLSLRVTDLSAFVAYSAYCYNENIFGFGNSIAEVRATRVDFVSLCCKTVSFTSVPVSLTTTVSTSGEVSDIFTTVSIAISSNPSENVTMTPVLTDGESALVDGDFSAQPTSFTFSKTSSVQTATFYLSIFSITTNNLTVGIDISGFDAGAYDAPDIAIIPLVSLFDPADAPIFQRAIFANNGASFFGVFDTSTDLGGFTDFFTCSLLFTFADAEISTCLWVNGTTFQAFSSANVDIGSIITVKPRKIRAICNVVGRNCTADQTTVETSVDLEEPLNPLTPTVVLNVASTVSLCNDLEIDPSSSTGDGSRDFTDVLWTVQDTILGSESASNIAAFLNQNASTGNSIVFVPASLLNSTTYVIRLQLTNFLGGTGSTSVTVVVVEDTTAPTVQIRGERNRVITADTSLTLFGSATLPVCASRTTLQFEYIVTTDGNSTGIVSQSSAPRNFLAREFTFTATESYVITLVVTTGTGATGQQSVNLYIDNGEVVALVQGGATKSAPLDRVLTLDASPSYDENLADGGEDTLTFTWTCVIGSQGPEFGNECGLFSDGATSVSGAVLTIEENTMGLNATYIFTVTVVSPDGRADTFDVSVEPSLANSAEVSITSSFTSINANQQLTLQGAVTANYSINCEWSGFFEGQLTPFTAVTKTTRSFTADQAESGINYPLRLTSFGLTSGRAYTFRLTAAAAVDSQLASFNEISIYIFSPPFGGSVSVSPSAGTAFATVFVPTASNWQAEIENYPLSFGFFYQLSSVAPSLQIRAAGETTSASTVLPEGLLSQGRVISVLAVILDANGAETDAATAVTVSPAPQANITNSLDDSINDFGDSQDTDALIAIINSVGATVSSVNCTGSPNCTALNRGECQNVPHTCEACYDGYDGVVGPYNTKCFNLTKESPSGIGEPCEAHEQCLYGKCDFTVTPNVCVAPPKLCQSNIPAQDNYLTNFPCSNNGECKYTDNVGTPITESDCSVFNANCIRRCRCAEGFGGKSCAFTQDELVSADSLRTKMCSALLDALQLIDKSAALLDSTVSSLFLSFSPDEVFTDDGLTACGNVLTYLTTVVEEGFIEGTSDATQEFLVSLMSQFIDVALQYNFTADVAIGSLSNFTSGVIDNKVNGQDASSFTSDFIRVIIQNVLASELTSATLAPPATSEETAYGVALPSIELGPLGLSQCSSSDGYARVQTQSFHTPPYPNTETNDTVASGQLALQTRETSGGGRRLQISNSSAMDAEIAYYVNIQFAQEQDFNESGTGDNFTFPLCSFFDSDTQTYTGCSGCNVSSYTNFNVTYACFDISQLCAGAADSTTRRLQSDVLMTIRSLAAYDDDTVGLSSTSSIAAYGALVSSLISVFVSVLSANPFAVDIAEVYPVVIMVGLLGIILLAGLVYFLRWDISDHQFTVYVEEEKNRKDEEEYYKKHGGKSKDEGAAVVVEDEDDEFDFEGERDSIINMFGTLGKNIVNRISDRDSAFENSDRNSVKRKFSTDEGFDESKVFEENDAVPLERKGAVYNMLDLPKSDIDSFIEQFLVRVIPNELLQQGKSFMRRVAHDVWLHHPYIRMLSTSANYSDSRVLRYLDAFKGFLIVMFVDTMFYSVFFVNDGQCESFTTRAECISEPSSYSSSEQKCDWDPTTEECSFAKPPETLFFIMIVALLCMIIAIPLDLMIQGTMDFFCARRPDLRGWRWVPDAWLGSSSRSLRINDDDDDVDGPDLDVGELEQMYKSDSYQVYKGILEKDAKHTRTNLGLLYDVEEQIALNDERTTAAQLYENYRSAEVETDQIFHYYRQIFRGDTTTMYDGTQKVYHDRALRLKALKQTMKCYPTGDPSPLSLYDRIWYQSPHDKMTQQIEKTRRRAEYIQGQVDQSSMVDKDQVLLQYFVLEQVNTFRRVLLTQVFFVSGQLVPDLINAYVWVLAWVFVTCMFLFLFYWTLLWGFQNGNHSYKSWGINFSIILAEDVFMVQPVKIIIVFVVSGELMRKQMIDIYRCLHHISLVFVQEGLDRSEEFRVVQRLSAACRASRFGSIKSLPAAFLLRQIDDIDILTMREHRGSYIGPILFLLIAVPSVLALLSEEAADAVFGVVVPSIVNFLALFVQFLANLHPAFVAVPIVPILLFILYYRYLLLPSRIIVADDDHSLHIRTAMNDGNKWFVSNRLRAKRGWPTVFANFMTAIAPTMVYISNPLFYYGRQRKMEKKRKYEEWRNMNVPQGYQGKVGGYSLSLQSANVDDLDTVPVNVIGLCKYYSRNMAKTNRWMSKFIQRRAFGMPEDTDFDALFYGDTSFELSINVVDDLIFKRSDEYKLSALTNDIDQVMQRLPIFCRHFNDVRVHNDFDLTGKITRKSNVSVHCVRAFVKGLIYWYYPRGEPFKPLEREEVMMEFERWAKRHSEQKYGELMVQYIDFQRWLLRMYSLVEKNESALNDRFVDEHNWYENFFNQPPISISEGINYLLGVGGNTDAMSRDANAGRVSQGASRRSLGSVDSSFGLDMDDIYDYDSEGAIVAYNSPISARKSPRSPRRYARGSS